MKKVLSVPIENSLNNFSSYLIKHEYQKSTINHYRKYLSEFLKFQSHCNKSACLEEHVFQYLGSIKPHLSKQSNYKYVRTALFRFYAMKTGTEISRHNTPETSETLKKYLAGFSEYLKNVRELSDLTIHTEIYYSRSFLEFEEKRCQAGSNFEATNITPENIRDYITKEINYLIPSSKGRVVTTIRNFFRYLQFSDIQINESIFALPLSPAVWKHSKVPKILTDEEFSALKSVFSGTNPTDIRNHAIIASFTELGLRCIEVANLLLDDFSWQESTISIRNTKTHLDRKLPIPSRLGGAITAYILHSRPPTSTRVLFVRFAHTKGEPMWRENIRYVVRKAYKICEFDKSLTGTHILRRTVASRLYNHGNSLKMVADILGHESFDSTVAYVKSNKQQLAQVAASWPGRAYHEQQ